MNIKGKNPDMIIIDEPMEGVDFELMEKMVYAKLATSKGSLEFKPEYGEPIDRYTERAKKDGITREEAKAKMFHEDYGCGTGVKDWKKDLRKLIVKNG